MPKHFCLILFIKTIISSGSQTVVCYLSCGRSNRP